MHLMTTASALSLQSYGHPAPEGAVFEKFSAIVLTFFERAGISPTYVGIEGKGYAGDYKKFGSRSHQKLVRSEFRGIRTLSIAANPEGSDEPSYDAFATASLGFIDSTKELLLCFVVNECFITFKSSTYDELWQSFLDLCSWDFGYGFSEEVEKQPEFHILGLDNGKLTPDEQTSLNAWYGALPDERLERLRGIYPYNFVSERQLANIVKDGLTLREFIELQPDVSLTQLMENGLSLWKIEESSISNVHAQLRESAALIS